MTTDVTAPPTPSPADAPASADRTAPAPTAARPRRPLLLALLIASAFFAAVAPTLRWQEFSGGSENLIVETVLEMRRGGPWLIPTLTGVPRMTKPPLAAWLTAAAVRPDTVARLTTRDRAARDAAFADLAWQVRWPSLLSSCLMLLATYALAVNSNLGPRVGLVAMAVCGSTLMFQRFGRAATTDVQLALWVTVTNAMLALALIRKKHWPGYLAAGAALGLAFMSKGPVALVQTVLPAAAFFAWRRFTTSHTPSPLYSGERAGVRGSDDPIGNRQSAIGNPGLAFPLFSALLLALAIGLPWYAHVVSQHRDIFHGWWIEITREGATQLPPDAWYMYAAFFLWIIPWLAWFIAGLWIAAVQTVRPSLARPDPDSAFDDNAARDGTVLALFLFLVPVVVMSFFRDKPERYLLPMLPPAAVLAARAAVAWYQSPRRDPGGRVVESLHWFTLAVLALGVPVAGLLMPRLGYGDRWFSPAVAIALGAVTTGTIALGYALRGRNHGAWPIAATGALILLLQFPVLKAYVKTDAPDLKPLADAVWADHPDAAVYEYDPTGRPRVRMDLPIYLGRLTSKTTSPLQLTQTDRAQVVVIFDRQAAAAPVLPSPWQFFAKGGNRKDAWSAYVLPPAPGQLK